MSTWRIRRVTHAARTSGAERPTRTPAQTLTARNDLIVLRPHSASAGRPQAHASSRSRSRGRRRPRSLPLDIGGGALAGGCARLGPKWRPAPRSINRHLARFILIGLYTGTRRDRILRLQWVAEPARRMGRSRTWHPSPPAETRRKPRSAHRASRSPMIPRQTSWGCTCVGGGVSQPASSLSTMARRSSGLCLPRSKQPWLAGWSPPGHPDRVSPHTLRHTCATWMLAQGRTPYQVGQYLGVTADLVDKTYGHATKDMQRETANAIGRRQNASGTSHSRPTNSRERA